MRAIWSGAVAFGLVNVPVKLFSATSSHDVRLHQVHDADGGRIRYQRRCEVCEEQVDYENIDRAYDDGEDTVILTDEDFQALPAESTDQEIEVLQFVPDEQIDPVTLESTYYVGPASKSHKAYVLLRRTLEDASRTAIARFSMRSHTQLAALRVRSGVIVLQTLRWADEVREPDFTGADADARITDREMTMARALVDQLSDDFDPAQFADDYQEQLKVLIREKLEHGDSIDTAATFGESSEGRGEDGDGGGDVIDLMEALKRSVDSKRSRSGGSAAASKGGGAKSSSSTRRASKGTTSSRTASSGAKSGSTATKKASSTRSSQTKGSAAKASAKTGARSSAAKTGTRASGASAKGDGSGTKRAARSRTKTEKAG